MRTRFLAALPDHGAWLEFKRSVIIQNTISNNEIEWNNLQKMARQYEITNECMNIEEKPDVGLYGGKEKNCNRCGYRGHTGNNCYYKDQECYKCHRIGHRQNMCKVNVDEDENENRKRNNALTAKRNLNQKRANALKAKMELNKRRNIALTAKRNLKQKRARTNVLTAKGKEKTIINLDSGCSNHAFKNAYLIEEKRRCNESINGLNGVVKINTTGKFMNSKADYVPSSPENLFSIGSNCKTNGQMAVFTANEGLILPFDNRILEIAKELAVIKAPIANNNCYYFEYEENMGLIGTKNPKEFIMWHQLLGHVKPTKLRKILDSMGINCHDSMGIDCHGMPNEIICDACTEMNIRTKKVNHKVVNDYSDVEKYSQIDIDLQGPFPPSMGGA
eukprot:Awhi_evm1s4548